MRPRKPVVIREKPYTLDVLAKMSGFTKKDVRELDAMADATWAKLEAERLAAANSAAVSTKPSKPRRRPAA